MIVPALLLLTLLQAPAGHAEGDLAPPPAIPMEVEVGLFVVDINEISEVDNAYVAEIEFELRWRDPNRGWDAGEANRSSRRLVNARAMAEIEKGWFVNASVVNASGDLPWTALQLDLTAEGDVVWRGRVNGRFRSPLDFRRFPFDRQVLLLDVESFSWDSRELRLIPDSDRTGIRDDLELPEWSIGEVRARRFESVDERRGTSRDRLRLEIDIERRSAYYVWKILAPLLAIVWIAGVVFWMPAGELGRRAGISSTGMLTVIAYQFIVSDSLPRVAYLTVMDRIILLTFLFVAMTMVANIISASSESRPFSVRLNRWARWVYPLAYVGGLFLLGSRL